MAKVERVETQAHRCQVIPFRPRMDTSFKAFSKIFMTDNAMLKLLPQRMETYRRTLDDILLPAFGPFDLRKITTEEIEDVLMVLNDSPRVADLSHTVLKAIFAQACLLGWRADNPALNAQRQAAVGSQR